MYLSFIQDWWLDIVTFVQSLDPLAIMAVLALLAIGVTVCIRFIIKHSFNVNAYKKNLTLPIIFTIILVGLIILLSVAYL